MLALTTPDVRTDQRLAGEFRPRTLETWLAQLPRTDRESCLEQLKKALSTQNRVALDPAVRLQLMELYLPHFQELYALHHSDLRAIARVPLHPHYRARQEQMLGMLEAMATGYKRAAVDLTDGRRGTGRDAGLALALQRAMHWLGEVLVTSYELYTRPPSGTWREVHELYRCAESEELFGVDVAPLPGNGSAANVRRTYLPILLLGAGSPYGLLPGEARRLYELAPQWRRSMRIITPTEAVTDPGHFRFNLDADTPPFPASKSSRPFDKASRVVRTLGVARAMHQVLTDLNEASTRKAVQKVLGPGMDMADAELFRRAGRVFGEVGITRASNRFPSRQDLAFCAGFDAVYVACNGGRPFRAPAATTAEAVSEPPAEGAAAQFIDLSEPLLGAPVDGGASRAVDGPVPGPHAPRRATSVNQSAGGLCLGLARSAELRLKVGDIAAGRFSGAAGWQLGVVRWMRVAARDIRFGLQFLGPVAVPVAVAGGSGAHRGSVVPAIWLPENPALKQGSSIVLPRGTEPYPPVLRILARDDAPGQVTLLRAVERTGDYEQFLVSLDPSSGDSQSSRSS